MIEDALDYARLFNQGHNPHFATAAGAYGLGIETGVDFDAVVEAGQFICEVLGRKPTSKVAQTIAGRSR